MRVTAWSMSLLLAATAVIAGCSNGGALLEQLDERAGLTLARSREPLVFARTEPRYSRSARDYLYLGPIETNRQGLREYYLWVGVATTLDRGFIAPAASVPRALYLLVDGEPMELPLRPFAELVRRTVAAPSYPTAVPLRAELAARLTLQQLGLIDFDRLDSIMMDVDTQSGPRRYTRWGGDGTFAEFLVGVAGAQ
jgi:hypothetical protein